MNGPGNPRPPVANHLLAAVQLLVERIMIRTRHSRISRGGRVICHLCPADCRLTPAARYLPLAIQQRRVLVTDNYGEAVTRISTLSKRTLYHFYPGSKFCPPEPTPAILDVCIAELDDLTGKCRRPSCPPAADGYRAAIQIAGVASLILNYVWLNISWIRLRCYGEADSKLFGYTDTSAGADEVAFAGGCVQHRSEGHDLPFYAHVCKAAQTVLENIQAAVAYGAHVELTSPHPGENDSDEDYTPGRFCGLSLTVDPLHFSAYHPIQFDARHAA